MKRPQTAAASLQNNWTKAFDKLQPVAEEDEQGKDNKLPDFEVPEGMNMISRSCVDGYRVEQMNEIESIKERLAKDHCPQSIVTL